MTTREIAAVVSAIIALVALFRPEWSILLRRWTSRLRLTTLPRLEVGFGYFGATIALVGTLRTLNHDQFIEEMRARVIRKTDHSRHEFKWAVFRPAVSLLPPKIEELQVAMGFLLSASTPKAVSIQLHDTATRSRADQNLAQLRNEFAKYLMNNKILIRDVVPSERVALYKKFSEAITRQLLRYGRTLTAHFIGNQGNTS